MNNRKWIWGLIVVILILAFVAALVLVWPGGVLTGWGIPKWIENRKDPDMVEFCKDNDVYPVDGGFEKCPLEGEDLMIAEYCENEDQYPFDGKIVDCPLEGEDLVIAEYCEEGTEYPEDGLWKDCPLEGEDLAIADFCEENDTYPFDGKVMDCPDKMDEVDEGEGDQDCPDLEGLGDDCLDDSKTPSSLELEILEAFRASLMDKYRRSPEDLVDDPEDLVIDHWFYSSDVGRELHIVDNWPEDVDGFKSMFCPSEKVFSPTEEALAYMVDHGYVDCNDIPIEMKVENKGKDDEYHHFLWETEDGEWTIIFNQTSVYQFGIVSNIYEKNPVDDQWKISGNYRGIGHEGDDGFFEGCGLTRDEIENQVFGPITIEARHMGIAARSFSPVLGFDFYQVQMNYPQEFAHTPVERGDNCLPLLNRLFDMARNAGK